MRLKILTLSAAMFAALGSAQAATDNLIAYTVAEGEDIQTIAGTYDISVEDILITNGKKAEEIVVGTVIYIPPKHATGFFDPATGVYTVAQGDDLYAISRRFGTTVAALETANGLGSAGIKVGAKLKIPD
ncbi:MAG: LysM peptidoglycan-binding domain-containing protein [Thiohalocapsa sp.]